MGVNKDLFIFKITVRRKNLFLSIVNVKFEHC